MGLLDQYNALSDNAKQYVLNKLARFGNGVGNTVQAIPANANRLAQGLLNLPQTAKNDIGGLLGPQMNKLAQQTYQPTLSSLITNPPQQANPQQWIDKGMELSSIAPVMGLLGHTVYHGSPHKFDKFDMSKIGTGEGAQAYGHGLYFAENPAVAKDYQNTLAYKADDGGQMYKVDIPDEAIPRMLDWDKPLSGQVPEIQAAARNLGITDAVNGQDLLWKIKRTKYDVREAMRGNTGLNDAGVYATQQLKAQGIPGIRYLDQASRGAGEGTSNYVLFDDALARIMEINGQPTGLKPWNAK